MTPKEALNKLTDMCQTGGELTITNPGKLIQEALRRAIPLLKGRYRVDILIKNEGDSWTYVVTKPQPGSSGRGAPRGHVRLTLEALEPGESTIFDAMLHTLENVAQTIATVQRNSSAKFTRSYDKDAREICVTRIDGINTELAQKRRGRPPLYDFGELEVGGVMFIEDATRQAVRQYLATYQSNHGQRHRIFESLYDDAIEVQRLPDNGRPTEREEDALAKARVMRVLKLEGFYRRDGSTQQFHGAELFAGQLEDILRILPAGERVTINGVPTSKLQQRAEFWRKKRGFNKAVVERFSMWFE